MSDPIELLRDLVSISSVSRQSNRPVIDFAQKVLAGAGWEFREYGYLDPHGVQKINLVAWPEQSTPTNMEFHLALVSHTDTVPYSSSWGNSTHLTKEGENLKGCGACDVKGFLACILSAATLVDCKSLALPLCIVLTADEEIGCVGARHLVERQVFRTKYAIVGEPTSLRPINAGKGYCLAEITLVGREAHSAYPENGRSAIYDAARLIGEIEQIGESLKESRDDHFFPPWTTINIGEIHGGVAKNIVPPNCRFLLEWRPISSQDPDLVPTLVQAAIDELQREYPDMSCHLRGLRRQEGFATSDQSQLVTALRRASGNATDSVAFGTEAPWLNKLGAEVVVFGPGSMQSAHSPDEFVPGGELNRCVEIVTAVIRDVCGCV